MTQTAGRVAGVVERRRPRRRNPKKTLVVLAFMSPWIVGFLAFILYPMLATLYFSFTKYDLLSDPVPYGIQNYVYMFTKDPAFWVAVRNTVWIIVWGLPLEIGLSILTAWMLTKPRRGMKVYRTIFFLPSLAPPVAVALAFVFIFNPATGPINNLLFHGWPNAPLWFYSPQWSKPAMLILGLWGIGSTMIIFLAGLLDVPRQLYEAADIEGASGWQKFRYVTWPSITPVVFFSLVTGVIYGFQFFTQAYVSSITVAGVTTRDAAANVGSPNQSLLFYSVYLWQQGWGNFRFGYASALAWMLFLVTMVCTILLVRTSKRWVHYAGGGFR